MHTSLHQLIRDGDVAQINLALAVEHASESSKEAPWYGAWALLLRKLEDYIVHDNQSGITTTIFFPQHPLTVEFAELEEMVDLPPNPSFPHQEDVINIDDEGNDLDPNVGLINMGMEDIHEPDPRPSQAGMQDVETDDDSDPIATYSDPVSIIRPPRVWKPTDITLSSPPSSDPISSYKVPETPLADLQQPAPHNNDLTQKPRGAFSGMAYNYSRKRLRAESMISDHDRPLATSSQHAGVRASSTLSTANSSVSLSSPAQLELKRILSLRSTNIPDFIRYIFRVGADGTKSKRVDLVIENKARRARVTLSVQVHQALMQATFQAVHAFIEDPTIKVVGAIVAVRDSWRYSEISPNQRATEDMEEKVREARKKDTTYKYQEKSPPSSPNNIQSSSPVPEDITWDNPTLRGPQTNLQQQIRGIFLDGILLEMKDRKTASTITLIAERLREMNAQFWCQSSSEGTSVEDNDSEGSEDDSSEESALGPTSRRFSRRGV